MAWKYFNQIVIFSVFIKIKGALFVINIKRTSDVGYMFKSTQHPYFCTKVGVNVWLLDDYLAECTDTLCHKTISESAPIMTKKLVSQVEEQATHVYFSTASTHHTFMDLHLCTLAL